MDRHLQRRDFSSPLPPTAFLAVSGLLGPLWGRRDGNFRTQHALSGMTVRFFAVLQNSGHFLTKQLHKGATELKIPLSGGILFEADLMVMVPRPPEARIEEFPKVRWDLGSKSRGVAELCPSTVRACSVPQRQRCALLRGRVGPLHADRRGSHREAADPVAAMRNFVRLLWDVQ